MKTPLLFLTLLCSAQLLAGQSGDSLHTVRGLLYTKEYKPVIHSHVINMSTGYMAISDSMGRFSIKARMLDSLIIKNIAFRDTQIIVRNPVMTYTIRMTEKYHPLPEAKIFPWGSTYDDFIKAFLEFPERLDLQGKLGIPKADPDAIPFYLDEKRVSSPMFALTSPISFLYYNLNKTEKSRRRLYLIEKNKEKTDRFLSIFNRGRVAELTGLTDQDLEDFWIYLHDKMLSGINNSELEILTEIMYHFKSWKKIHQLQ